MNDLVMDVRHAFRVVARHRGAFALAAACLGLGIGLTTTMFASADPWLFRPLPYRDPDRLVAVREVSERRDSGSAGVSVASYLEWRRGDAFDELGAFSRLGHNLSTDEEPERVHGAAITASLFPMLGARPVVGRTFTADEDRPGGPRVCLIGHELWRRRFGGEAVLGRRLRIDGEEHTVVGVMPAEWAFPEYAEVWTPLRLDPGDRDRSRRWLDVIGRLRSGATFDGAEAELAAGAQRAAAEHPESSAGWGVAVVPMLEVLTPPGVRAALVLMLCATGFVLLIACANVSNLLLAQAIERRREIATRLALGAGTLRLVRQLLTESLLLALAGGTLGLLLAAHVVDLQAGSTPIRPPFWAVTGLNPRAVAATLGASLLASIVCGLLPALEAARLDLRSSLQEGGRDVGGRRPRRLGDRLVIAQLAVSLVLLSGAALMVRSFQERQRADLGFDVRNALVARVTLAGGPYGDPAARRLFLEELVRRVRSLPAVETAAAVTALPISDEQGGGWSTAAFEIEGRPVPVAERPVAVVQGGTVDGLAALGIPLVRGRAFRESETVMGASPVVVVSEGLARDAWPQGDAVGRRLRLGDGPWLTVVGVAGETREPTSILGIGGKPSGQIYVPYVVNPAATMTLVLRGPRPSAFADALRDVMRSMDPSLPLYGVRTLREARRRSDWVAELWGRTLGWSAAAALLLVCTGVYGVVSRGVARRRREIGVRMALGADRRALLGLVLRQAMRLAAAGLAIGVVGALLLNRSLAGLLYGVSPSDPLTLVGGVALLLVVTLLATLAPAVRASRVDPLVALRSE